MRSAREAIDALRRVTSLARDHTAAVEAARPSAEALDELAQVADLLGRAVEDVAGTESRAVRDQAVGLASAIVAHRDSLDR